MAESRKKSGLAVLVGRSNVGKSTLLNSLVGTKVAITTPKPQTTRHVIQGVINDERGQIVLVDTPGVFKKVPDRITSRLNEKARESLKDIDVIVYVVDPTRHIGDEEKLIRRMVDAAEGPKILLVNKSDLRAPFRDEYLDWSDDFDAVIEASALAGKNLKLLTDTLFSFMPEGDPLYPKGQLTNVPNLFWFEELIREKVFMTMRDEVPYSTTVKVHEVTDRKDGTLYINASIVTSSPRHKKILIGKGGASIKRIGQAVRKELELVTSRKVFLDMEVVVEEKWQDTFE